MASLNLVQLIGNLGSEVEVRAIPTTGKSVGHFSLATTETYKKDGEKIEETEWHRITVWGPLAENCAKYLQKGSGVFVQGRIKQSEYLDKDKQMRVSFEIVAHDVQFLTKTKGKGGEAKSEPSADGASAPSSAPEAA